jgi:hypothetical protein
MRCVLVLVMFAACNSGGGKMPDASVDAFFTECGAPGDVGNELGIGKFCLDLADCSTTTSARLCSSLGDPDTHFCTKMCTMGSTDQCGTGTQCVCDSSNRCGCTPTVCLQ